MKPLGLPLVLIVEDEAPLVTLLRYNLEREGFAVLDVQDGEEAVAVAREQLLDAVWGREVYVEPRTVDVHIRRLRKAINGPSEPDLIRTVRSAGYALDEKG